MAVNVELHVYAIRNLLSRPERNYLLRNNGDQVAISTLKRKKLGLYFSASWCLPYKMFTENLEEAYGELMAKGDFEVVFVSGDRDVESFNGSFSKMPWLAVPFTDSKTQKALYRCFKVNDIPSLLLLDENGKLLSDDGVGIILEYGAQGYPFTPERIKEIKEPKEEARRNQSLRSILESPSRDFVLTGNRSKIYIRHLLPTLKGMVGLYFTVSSCRNCSDFTTTLAEVYNELNIKGEKFDIVMVLLDDNEESFRKAVSMMSWFSFPFKDKKGEQLAQRYCSVPPTLVIIGPDGKILHPNVVDAIVDHGANAYPFTPDKFSEIEKIDKGRQQAQTLQAVLISGDADFVVGKNGAKIPVSDLVGKYILLYFSAHWCPSRVALNSELVEMYHMIKAKHDKFEVIFISCDNDQASYEEYYSTMPWLTLPLGDERERSLSRLFKVKSIPSLVAIGPNGKTITRKAFELIMIHGAMVFPFTDERVAEINGDYDEMSKGLPEKVKHVVRQEHEALLSRTEMYECDGCNKEGRVWAYSCQECDFDLHPECALKGKEDENCNDWLGFDMTFEPDDSFLFA